MVVEFTSSPEQRLFRELQAFVHRGNPFGIPFELQIVQWICPRILHALFVLFTHRMVAPQPIKEVKRATINPT